jgi:hypothetical protein
MDPDLDSESGSGSTKPLNVEKNVSFWCQMLILIHFFHILCAIRAESQHIFGPDNCWTLPLPIKVSSHDSETLLMVGIRNKYSNICRYSSRFKLLSTTFSLLKCKGRFWARGVHATVLLNIIDLTIKESN